MRNVWIGLVFTTGCSPSFNAKSGMVDTTTIDPGGEGGWEARRDSTLSRGNGYGLL